MYWMKFFFLNFFLNVFFVVRNLRTSSNINVTSTSVQNSERKFSLIKSNRYFNYWSLNYKMFGRHLEIELMIKDCKIQQLKFLRYLLTKEQDDWSTRFWAKLYYELTRTEWLSFKLKTGNSSFRNIWPIFKNTGSLFYLNDVNTNTK